MIYPVFDLYYIPYMPEGYVITRRIEGESPYAIDGSNGDARYAPAMTERSAREFVLRTEGSYPPVRRAIDGIIHIIDIQKIDRPVRFVE